MTDKNRLALAFLLQSGYTHNDLKKLFPQDDFDAVTLWERTKKRDETIEIPLERREKIFEKSEKCDETKITSYIEEKDIHLTYIYDLSYPVGLREISHAPFFLYIRGNLRGDLPPCIGVVGSRKHSSYAPRILSRILPDIVAAGIGIVSGGATGVDTLAHEITLEAGGYTIAVFGTGIDRCYPSTNKYLFEKILEKGGALISHFPLGTPPELYNFPIRNEIVAAISRGILIPEAALSSGTLITAQLALEHGRDVFAVPGDIDRMTSEGTNMLISTGQAKITRCAGDILEEYFDIASLGKGMTPIVKMPPIFTNNLERSVYEAIDGGADSVDTLLIAVQVDMTDLLTTIAMLELGGYVKMDEMGKYQVG